MKKQTTIRFSKELIDQLDSLSERTGFTRSELLKSAIINYLLFGKLDDFVETPMGSGDFIRTAIYFNDRMKAFLTALAEKHNTSINSLIIYSAKKGCEDYSKLLKKLNL